MKTFYKLETTHFMIYFKRLYSQILFLLLFFSSENVNGQGACMHTVTKGDPAFANSWIPMDLIQPVSTISVGITSMKTASHSLNQSMYIAYDDLVASYIRIVATNGHRAILQAITEKGDTIEIFIRSKQTIDLFVKKVILKTDYRIGESMINFPENGQYETVKCPGQKPYKNQIGSYRLNVYGIIENTLNNLRLRWADEMTLPTTGYEDYGDVLVPPKYPNSRLIFMGDEPKTIEVMSYPSGLMLDSVYIEIADDYNRTKNYKSIKLNNVSKYVRGKYVWVTYKSNNSSPLPTPPKPPYPYLNTRFRYRVVNN